MPDRSRANLRSLTLRWATSETWKYANRNGAVFASLAAIVGAGVQRLVYGAWSIASVAFAVGAILILILGALLVNVFRAPFAICRSMIDESKRVDDELRGQIRLLEEKVEQLRPQTFLRIVGVDTGRASPARRGPSGQPLVTAPVPHEFVRVLVANDPPEGVAGESARKVIGRITFVSVDGEHAIDELLGRWSGAPQPVETGLWGPTLEDFQADIEPNGLRHAFDIAMKRPHDDVVYAYSDKNNRAPDLCLPEHRLPDAEYRVIVLFRGSNTPEVVGEFVLKNGGVGGAITLEEAPPTSRPPS